VDLHRIPSGNNVRITGILLIVHTLSTKSGKRVIFITMKDETGLIDVVAFLKAQTHNARSVWTSEVPTVEGQLHRQGKNRRSISIVMEKVVPHLTGMLADFLKLPENESQSGSEPPNV
jgi:error-prone DNA polymerase